MGRVENYTVDLDSELFYHPEYLEGFFFVREFSLNVLGSKPFLLDSICKCPNGQCNEHTLSSTSSRVLMLVI